jgi:hypothetical protein
MRVRLTRPRAPARQPEKCLSGLPLGDVARGPPSPRRVDTHDGLVRIIQSLRDRDGAEAVILAGTELPLILTEATVAGIPLLDTARIHVHAAAERLWR